MHRPGASRRSNSSSSPCPSDLGLAYVVVVHLAPDRKSELPGIIARWTTMPVVQVGDDDTAQLEPNHVYVIAPDRELVITDIDRSARPRSSSRAATAR